MEYAFGLMEGRTKFVNNPLVITLIVSQVIVAIFAIYKALQGSPGNKRFPKLNCMAFSMLLAAVSWTIAFWQGFSAPAVWLAAGMTLSFIGDLSMAGLLPWRHYLIGGMLSFGIAHICYLASFAGIANTKGIAIVNSAFIIGAVLLIVSQTWVWRKILRVPDQPQAIVNGSFIYGLLVGGTAVAAAGLWQATGGHWWLPLAGGLLFVLSDFFIGWSDIGGRRMKSPHLWIWVTYGIAQVCIVYSPLIHEF